MAINVTAPSARATLRSDRDATTTERVGRVTALVTIATVALLVLAALVATTGVALLPVVLVGAAGGAYVRAKA